jgi:P2 family phage contractile tail tube protein
MALPRTLKNMNLFNDGQSYLGVVTEVTLPKLSRKMEEYRAGGMNGPVQVDLGHEALEMEWTVSGLDPTVLTQYAHPQHNGVALRFAGAYQRDDTAAMEAVEIVIRGRHQTLDFGTAKPGELTECKVTTALSYYKLTLAGKEIIEIDVMNTIEKVNGIDRLAEMRQAIGL